MVARVCITRVMDSLIANSAHALVDEDRNMMFFLERWLYSCIGKNAVPRDVPWWRGFFFFFASVSLHFLRGRYLRGDTSACCAFTIIV